MGMINLIMHNKQRKYLVFFSWPNFKSSDKVNALFWLILLVFTNNGRRIIGIHKFHSFILHLTFLWNPGKQDPPPIKMKLKMRLFCTHALGAGINVLHLYLNSVSIINRKNQSYSLHSTTKFRQSTKTTRSYLDRYMWKAYLQIIPFKLLYPL